MVLVPQAVRLRVKVPMQELGKLVVILGVILIFIGCGLWFAGKVGLPLGSLPGDIRVQREKFVFYFPVVTCIVLSLFLTILFALINGIFRR